jgi:hypothetical protein
MNARPELRTRRIVGVSAQGITTSPFAQRELGALARERLATGGFSEAQIARVLDGIPVATDDQIAVGTLLVGCPEQLALEVDVAALLAIVEGAMSSEIFELMKRSDEGAVVERAHRRPRVAGDCVQALNFGAIQQLESRSDEELEREQKYRAAAMAILGARAAERYDAAAARSYFQRAVAAARPQERMQLRRMADASLALAERRPADLKQAVERLGQTPPNRRQLLILRVMGLLAPPPGAGLLARLRGFMLLLLIVIGLLLIGFGIVKLIALPFGGVSTGVSFLLGLLVIITLLGVLALIGRRRQAAMRAKARAGG